MMEERGYARFEPRPIDAGFRPATKEQIEEWASWLSTPEAAAAAERVDSLEASAVAAYNNYKFSVKDMEMYVNNMYPDSKSTFLSGRMWLAYTFYAKEQRELLNAYDSATINIKTDEAYDKAEKAHKALLQHVNTHGQLIRELPKHEHKKFVPASAPPKKGRRAKRAARNKSESSEASIPEKKDKVSTTQAYSAAT